MTNTHDEWLWTDWAGGECPLADESWRPRFRDGGTTLSPTNPSVYRWEHWGTEADIIAYAVRNPDYVAPATAPVDHMALLRQFREALEHAKMFIENGVELGFIQLPTSPDPALETPAKISAALEAMRKAGVM